VLLPSGPTEREVPLRVESSTIVVENVDDVDSCKRYAVAPEEAFQVKVVVIGTLEAPFAGDASAGADGGFGSDDKVVKLEIVQSPDPPELIARTCQ
jgi:hypothetical protein